MIREPMKVQIEETSDPEKSLWRAVLGQAFEDAFGPERYEKTKAIKQEAVEFLTNYSDVSFINVCENAGFDPSFIKRKVRKKFAEKFVFAINNMSTKVRNKNE
jgi:hypothetical protein